MLIWLLVLLGALCGIGFGLARLLPQPAAVPLTVPKIGHRLELHVADVATVVGVALVTTFAAAVLWVNRPEMRTVAMLLLVGTVVGAALSLKVEHLGQNDLLFLTQGRALAKTWRGETVVVLGKWHKTTTSSVGFQAAKVDVEALANDAVKLNVEISFAYIIAASTDPTDPEYIRKFWKQGSSDSVRDNVAKPQAMMAVREILGGYSAIEAATTLREPIRQQIHDRMVVLYTLNKLSLLGVTLGNVSVEEAYRERLREARSTRAYNQDVSESLSPNILEQERIHAIEKANTIYIPTGQALHGMLPGKTPVQGESPR